MKRAILPVKSTAPAARIAPFVRNDGLVIFEDADDAALNRIRRRGTRRQVILAVAVRRCQQVARAYAKKYAPDLLAEIRAAVECRALEMGPRGGGDGGGADRLRPSDKIAY